MGAAQPRRLRINDSPAITPATVPTFRVPVRVGWSKESTCNTIEHKRRSSRNLTAPAENKSLGQGDPEAFQLAMRFAFLSASTGWCNMRSARKRVQVLRRNFLTGSVLLQFPFANGAGKLPPVRAITKGPGFHWFGYYDKLQFDPGSRYALGVEGSFEHRLPRPGDTLRIGMVDLHDRDRWIDLGQTRAWSWHQTCMLQWLPGSSTEIIYNDREGDKFVSRILNVKTRKSRTLPLPVYCVSPDARSAIVNDFRRSSYMRPETGYAGLDDPFRDSPAPEQSGIWRMDLHTGKSELIISLAQVVAIPHAKPYSKGAQHYFDHLLFSPDGRRFAFFQRWRGEAEGRGFSTRMLTANADGSDIRVLDPHGRTSHYVWRDPKTILVWMEHPAAGSKFYLVDEPAGKVEVFAPDKMPVNGHASYLPGKRYIVCDTYPDANRLQHIYLYDTKEMFGTNWVRLCRRKSTPAIGGATRHRASAPMDARSS
jgi:hypothetical protein